MSDPAPVARRRLTLVAIAVVVAIFAAVVAGIAWRARGWVRDLVLQRDGRGDVFGGADAHLRQLASSPT